MHIDISAGELIDRYTILQIKSCNITDLNRLEIIHQNIDILFPLVENLKKAYPEINRRIVELRHANAALWEVENSIRIKENKKEFDQEFVNLARQVYIGNDHRSQIKEYINNLVGNIGEIKQYTRYVS